MPVCSLAILMAFSFASAPPLVKKTFSMPSGASAASRLAASPRASLAWCGAIVVSFAAWAAIAAVTFARVLYGKGHRYGTPTMGTGETIKTFTTDDLRGFYGSAFRPDNAMLLAVGDINFQKKCLGKMGP